MATLREAVKASSGLGEGIPLRTHLLNLGSGGGEVICLGLDANKTTIIETAEGYDLIDYTYTINLIDYEVDVTSSKGNNNISLESRITAIALEKDLSLIAISDVQEDLIISKDVLNITLEELE